MKRAIIESRPYLLLSLLFGISYFFVKDGNIPGMYLMFWKGAGVGFLAVYALRRAHNFEGKLIAAVMAFGALGDALIEIDLMMGAVTFIVSHCVAIWLYARHRRESTSFSQKAFAALLIPITIFIAWSLPFDRAEAPSIAAYSLFLAVMAAMAWTSGFPRYRVGIGALLFIISDLLIFSEMGFLENSRIPGLTVWPLYYVGQFLIVTGVVRTLRKEMHVPNP
ncbi:lysoplasmalogenase [Parasphingorhabdus litoris]|uniref:Lysoplasmalogenase n=1 Tax=Parasphingorhabdus litoris TaxID=394733 RepID=A0ABN1AQR2_9SPHN|nr:lysoplasmalogenase [Parasphingorhabdus litoris]